MRRPTDTTMPTSTALELQRPLNAGSMLSRMLGEACAGLRTLAQFNEDPELADDTFLLVRQQPLDYCKHDTCHVRGSAGAVYASA